MGVKTVRSLRWLAAAAAVCAAHAAVDSAPAFAEALEIH